MPAAGFSMDSHVKPLAAVLDTLSFDMSQGRFHLCSNNEFNRRIYYPKVFFPHCKLHIQGFLLRTFSIFLTDKDGNCICEPLGLETGGKLTVGQRQKTKLATSTKHALNSWQQHFQLIVLFVFCVERNVSYSN